ncbi:hypothetical protein KFE25_013161 [Diacronema lutheri]|uniref:Uncharacterized protein n=1 Tax=Diacronema lutheri TaxID=2081491 RepID=A0A8J5X480_DIALT|nr:hypothetical protein KFE25_013161 [Diacronema lutheri]
MTAALTPPAWAARRFAPSPPLRTDGLIPFDQAIAYARGCCEMMCSPETIDLLARAAADGATLDALTARWHAELLEQCGLESAFAMSAFRSDTDPSRFDFAPSPAAHAAGDATADVGTDAAAADDARARAEQWAEFSHALMEVRKGTISLIGGALHFKPWRCRRFTPARALSATVPIDPSALLAYAQLSRSFLRARETIGALCAAARAGEDAERVLAKWKCEMLEACAIERSHGLAALHAAAAARAIAQPSAARSSPHGASDARNEGIARGAPTEAALATALATALGVSATAERALLVVASVPDARSADGARIGPLPSAAGARVAAGRGGAADGVQLQCDGPLDAALPAALLRALAPHVRVSAATGASALAAEAERACAPRALVAAAWQRQALEALGVEPEHGWRELSVLLVNAAVSAAGPSADAPVSTIWPSPTGSGAHGLAVTAAPSPPPRAPSPSTDTAAVPGGALRRLLALWSSIPTAARSARPAVGSQAIRPMSAQAARVAGGTALALAPSSPRAPGEAAASPAAARVHTRVAMPPLGLARAHRESDSASIALRALPAGAVAAKLAASNVPGLAEPPIDPIVSTAQTSRAVRPGSARARVRPGWRPASSTANSSTSSTPRAQMPTPLTPRTPLPTPRALTLAHRTLAGASCVRMAT